MPFDTWDDVNKQGLALKEADPNTAVISWHTLADGDFGGIYHIGKSILTMMHDMLYQIKTAIAAPTSANQDWSSPIYREAFSKNEIATVLGPPWHIAGLGRSTAIGPSS